MVVTVSFLVCFEFLCYFFKDRIERLLKQARDDINGVKLEEMAQEEHEASEDNRQ